ncbi:MAG: YchJ family protein [Magnetospirillum sp.]|nr:YchJ family protein [Magnetospirillum sp.]
MTSCPCGSGRGYDECCGPLLAGGAAASPEALMRSRYTAFTRADLDYLENTLAPEAKEDYDRGETETWVKEAKWDGLEVRGATMDGDQGTVEFVARYKFRGKVLAHHELGSFRRHEGRWVYVDGVMNPRPAQRTADKVGRNDPCPCGSGKKYKKCCGA